MIITPSGKFSLAELQAPLMIDRHTGAENRIVDNQFQILNHGLTKYCI